MTISSINGKPSQSPLPPLPKSAAQKKPVMPPLPPLPHESMAQQTPASGDKVTRSRVIFHRRLRDGQELMSQLALPKFKDLRVLIPGDLNPTYKILTLPVQPRSVAESGTSNTLNVMGFLAQFSSNTPEIEEFLKQLRAIGVNIE